MIDSAPYFKKEQHYDKEKNNIVDHIAACGIASSL
jgi:hypothetical protein